MGIFSFKSFFLKVCIIFWVKFLHLGCYQADEISINKMYLCNAYEEAFRYIYTLFNAARKDTEC